MNHLIYIYIYIYLFIYIISLLIIISHYESHPRPVMAYRMMIFYKYEMAFRTAII